MCLSYSFIISRLAGLRTERRRLTNNCLPMGRDYTTRWDGLLQMGGWLEGWKAGWQAGSFSGWLEGFKAGWLTGSLAVLLESDPIRQVKY